MIFLAVHPSALIYSRVYLRLEPLGLELVAQGVRRAGHDTHVIDLQVETHKDYFRLIHRLDPDVVAFSCNYLANVPEVIHLARETRLRLPRSFILVGGHSASFVPREILRHSGGAVDCILRGEGEAAVGELLKVIQEDRGALDSVPGVVTAEGEGPPPRFVGNLDDLQPARDLLRHRRRYFIGVLDPCASIEFSRGCPWDCVFCSAWTFYGRSHRVREPEGIAEEMERIREPGVFIVDDVAFIRPDHGLAIGEALARRNIRKQYYLETRGDVFLRNREVFEFWKELGLKYMFLGLEAIDSEGLNKYRKRISLSGSFEALEQARSTGITVAVNIIADPDWDRERFEVVRGWCMEIPEIVNISVNTPYPGTETWRTESRELTTLDYRLFDIQHAVLPTRLPLGEFYEELVKTQRVLSRKHMGWRAARSAGKKVVRHLLRGQSNFLKMLWKFDRVINPQGLLADHRKTVEYELTPPPGPGKETDPSAMYVHLPRQRGNRPMDDPAARFMEGGDKKADT